MALNPLRLRRALSLSSSLLHRSLHQPKPFSHSSHLLSTPTPTLTTTTTHQLSRPFTSTTALFQLTRKPFNPETDEIGPDTILFEGCDYNHWLITIEFPKEVNISREQMIETYVNTAAQIFGSVEEAKKKIYALSTTTYQGFQVECSEETSEKFKGLPGVVFVLPDSYIDPVNKEYGGDKYVNGEIFPRPPPVQYGRRNNRDRRPYNNEGPPPQQNYGPPRQQNFGPPPPQQNFGPPPPQQNFGPPPPQQNYGPPPPQQQNYGRPPPPQQQNYGPPPPRQNYGPPPQQNYGNSPNFPPQQNYGPPSPGGNPTPSYQGNFNQGEAGNYNAQGQRNFQPRGVPDESNYGSPQGGGFGQRNYPSTGNN